MDHATDSEPSETLRRQLEHAVGEYVPGPSFLREPRQNGKKRFTELLHNFCHDPLPWYKNLEPSRPQWPKAMRKYTQRDGFRVPDLHNVEVSARDMVHKTKKGLLRTSSGLVTYSATHRMQFELDAEDLAKILREKVPHLQDGKVWSVKKLEKAYQSQFRRHGSWSRQGVTLRVFLSLFPKTFDLFGANNDFVRLANKSRKCAVDCSEDAMISLAMACEQGYVQRTLPLEGTMKAGQESRRFHELSKVRAAALFRSFSDPGLRSHTLPPPASRAPAADSSLRLPPIKANTMPALATAEGDAFGSTLRISDIDEARSTFRVSFMRED